ncbi:hypothetical protein D3C72_1393780 [compost metagenome]
MRDAGLVHLPDRQRDADPRPLPHLAVDADRAFHALHPLLHDGQAQPHPRLVLGGSQPLEGFEDALPVFRRDAAAGVAHRHCEPSRTLDRVARIGRDVVGGQGQDAAARELGGVVDQVGQHLPHALAIHFQHGGYGLRHPQHELVVLPGGDRRGFLGDGVQQGVHVFRRHAQRLAAGASGVIDQVVHHAQHVVGATANDCAARPRIR